MVPLHTVTAGDFLGTFCNEEGCQIVKQCVLALQLPASFCWRGYPALYSPLCFIECTPWSRADGALLRKVQSISLQGG